MSESESARDAALRGLVERGVVSAGQAGEVRAALEAAGSGPGRVRWMEIAGYIGGGLVLSGAVALVVSSWEEIGVDARIGLLAVLAAVSAVGAVFMAGGPREMRGRGNRVPDVRRRIAGVLLALAAVLTAFSVGSALPDGPTYPVPLVGLAVAAAGYAALPSAVGQVAAWGMGAALVTVLTQEIEAVPGENILVPAGALLCLGLAWTALPVLGVAAERRLALGLGAGLALAAGQLPPIYGEGAAWGYAATVVVAAACIAYYYRDRAPVLLVLGILGVTVGLPELVWDLTDGAIGMSAVLLVAGALLLGAGWSGLLVHRRGDDGQAPPDREAPGGPAHTGPSDTGPHPVARP
ncbi:DUF2157 domain-containing protein [Streptomonospora salina]|uniref:Putative membrane protein n=1 Tax=Streptomonospora salina TaxID=104205 RepID=A0A841ELW2_9ACTN|nr:DUF2157 domain-containing protein [Streptomonospora salina]MBB6001300.1 putative membrane protein [Streptomonospora salina]